MLLMMMVTNVGGGGGGGGGAERIMFLSLCTATTSITFLSRILHRSSLYLA